MSEEIGGSHVKITADDKQARKKIDKFVDYLERNTKRVSNKFSNMDKGTFGRLEMGVERAARTINEKFSNLPDHLKPFQDSLSGTRKNLYDLGNKGADSLDELSKAAIKSKVQLEKLHSVTESGDEAVEMMGDLADRTRKAQLAIMGLNETGDVQISAEEATEDLEDYRQEISRVRAELELLKKQGDVGAYAAGMKVLEANLYRVQRSLKAVSKGGNRYVDMLDELGVNTSQKTNAMAVAMEAYKDRFIRAIDRMNAKSSDSKKMMDILPETSKIEKVDRAFLRVGDALEGIAKKGKPANIAIEMLGRDAPMKALYDRIKLINKGIERMKVLAMGTGIAFLAFTYVMGKAAKGPNVAEVLQKQKEAWAEYAKAVKDRTEEIAHTWELFQEVQIEVFKPEKLMKNLQEQVKAMENWMANINNLASRGVSEGFIQYLRGLGPAAVGEVRALSKMTDGELTKYVDLWEKKHRLAKEAALSELEILKEQTKVKVQALKDSLKPLGIAMHDFRKTWAEALKPFVEIWGQFAAVVVKATTKIGDFVNWLNELNPSISRAAGMFMYLFTAMLFILSPMAIGIGRAMGMRAAFLVLWKVVRQFVLGFLRVAGVASIVSAAIVIVVGSFMKMWSASENLRNAVKNLWTELVDGVKSAVGPLIPDLKNMASAFLEMANTLIGSEGKGAKDFWKQLGDIVAVVVNLITKYLLPVFINNIKMSITIIRGLVIALGYVFKGLTYVIESVVQGAIKTWRGLTIAWNATVNFFTTTVPSWINSMIAWFKNLGSRISESFSNMVNGVVTWWQNLRTRSAQETSSLVETVVGFFVGLYNRVVASIVSFVTGIVNWFVSLGTQISLVVSTFINNVVNFFVNLGTRIMTFLQPFFAYFVATWENLKLAVLGIINVFVGLIIGDFEQVLMGLYAIWIAIRDQAVMAWTNFSNTVTSIVRFFVDGVTAIWNFLVTATTTAWNWLVSTSIAIWQGFLSGLTSIGRAIWTGIQSAFTALVNGSISLFNRLVSGSIALFNRLVSGTINLAQSIYRGVINGFNALVSGSINLFNRMVSGIINFFRNLWSNLVSTVSSIRTAIVNGFQNAVSAAINAFQNLVSSIARFGSNILSTVMRIGRDITRTFSNINLYQIGRDIVFGLMRGVGSMIGAVRDKAREIAGSIKESLKKALKSKSPSKVTWQIGTDVGKGIFYGIDDMIRKVSKKSVELAKAATPNIGPVDVASFDGSAMSSLSGNVKGNAISLGAKLVDKTQPVQKTHQHYWNVQADEINDVQKLVSMVEGVTQAVNKGGYD